MKDNRKRVFITFAIAIILIVLVVTLGILANNINNKAKKEENNKEKDFPVIEDLVKHGLEFKNLKITEEENYFNLLVDLENNTDKEVELELINVILFDKKGNEIITLPYLANTVLKPGDKHLINTNVDMDIRDAIKVDYELAPADELNFVEEEEIEEEVFIDEDPK